MELPLQLLDPPAVLPGLHRTGRPRLAETGNRILLPGLQLRRIQPLLAAPGAPRGLIHRRDDDHRLQPCRWRPRLGRDRAPSLRRHYPASSVLRAHPPSASAGAGPHGFAVGLEVPPPCRGRRLPLLHTVHVPCVLPSLPRWDRQLRISLASLTTAAFPIVVVGRLPH